MTALVSIDGRPPRVAILSSVHLALDNRVFYREARTLVRAGYDVTVIAVHERDEVRDGITIRAMPTVPRWQRPLLWRRLFDMAVATQADIFHFHDPELLLVSPLLRRFTSRPTIYDIHEAYPEFIQVKEYLPRWLRRPLAGTVRVVEPAIARHESALVFADDQIAATFATVNRPKATVFNYPELDHFSAEGPRLGTPNTAPPTVLYLGGMERNRGADILLPAFAHTKAAVPDAQLLLVGHFAPPELEADVRQQAVDYGLRSAVTLTGRVPFDDVPGYLRRASVGWVPWQAATKNNLNIPTKLFEYMIAGLPVVASDLPSIRPYVEQGKSGLLVPPDDPRAHAEALAYLLGHPDESAAMGERGRELVITRYNWGTVAPRLLDLYAEVLRSAVV